MLSRMVGIINGSPNKPMKSKFTFNTTARISLGTLAAIAMTAVILPKSALAEEKNRASDLLEPQQLQLERAPFNSTTGEGESLDVFDLIHRAQFGTTRSMKEFNLQQQQSINDAAADFRSRQLEMLYDQQPEISGEEALPNP